MSGLRVLVGCKRVIDYAVKVQYIFKFLEKKSPKISFELPFNIIIVCFIHFTKCIDVSQYFLTDSRGLPVCSCLVTRMGQTKLRQIDDFVYSSHYGYFLR